MASMVSHSSSSSFLKLNFTNDSSFSFSATLSFSRPQFPNSASQKRNINENYRGYTVKCALAKTRMPPSPASDAYIREPHKYFDEVVITVRAGDGGHGAVLSMPNNKAPSKSQGKFDRDKTKKKASYKRDFDGSIILPMGGHGGDVVLYADESKDSLLEFHNKSKHKAKRGGNVDSMGVLTSHMQNGAASPTLRIPVPLGTVVKLKKGKFLADLANPGDEVLVARGGQGGISLLEVPEYKRKQMTTLTTNIMRDATDKVLSFGQSGEEVNLQLILRVVADVGLVGLPNAGKSTLLAAITHARPDIADYPFTTLMPNLGRLDGDPSLGADKYSSEATLADLPGLIEGAHLGKGLGRNFLRHLRRTRLLVHVVDAAAEDPVGDYRTVKEELRMYNPEYLDRPYLVVLNKIDKPEAIDRLPTLTEEIRKIGYERISPKRDTSSGAVAESISVDESQNSELSNRSSSNDQKVKELEEYPRPLAVVGVSVLKGIKVNEMLKAIRAALREFL
ncbi:probable GTP-binding protein OBGC2 [Solanum tuberosum]|uniref:GTP-dependent nucleic acid-binding protein engD n=1 Tax=Solanum tuberosum TaxID=4113 RepID=M0ZWD6_SOLTU|nr:PREDICTED: probable GTP-binding protein OBGC2 [Solanum tuberosum]